MSSQLPTVFLSSTIHDLKDLRDAVQTALRSAGYKVLASEDGSIPVDSKEHSYDVCLKAAKECECLVAALDGRFGGTLPDGKTSITQAEVEVALNNARQVFVFVRQSVWDAKEIYNSYAKAGYPFVPNKIVTDKRVFDLIDTIRQRTTGNWIFQFNRPSDLIKTVLFQLESFQASKTEGSVDKPLQGVAAIEVLQIKDVSTTSAKRYSAFLIVGRDVDRAGIRDLVTAATEQLKTESYQRPGPMKERWAKKQAQVIWTYVAGHIEDIDQGNWVCRSLWIDPSSKDDLAIEPLGGDEKVNGIEFIWNPDYHTHKQFVAEHRASKGAVLSALDQLIGPILKYADLGRTEFANFNKGASSEAELAAFLQKHCEDVREVFLKSSDIGFGPADTTEAIDLCGLLAGSVDEMYDAYSPRSMAQKTAIQRRIQFEVAESTFGRDLKRWEVTWEKVHHS